MRERMPEHPGLRMMEERALLAMSGRAVEPVTNDQDSLVRLKGKTEKGQSFHFSVPRSQATLFNAHT